MEQTNWETLKGTTHKEEWLVTEDMLACGLKSGTVRVFATPYMAALMEYASLMLVQPCLPQGITTVGTRLEISHDSPTPAGMRVWAEAVLIETDGRRFVFRVAAYDEKGLIGQGTHERCSVKQEKFEAKAAEKLPENS